MLLRWPNTWPMTCPDGPELEVLVEVAAGNANKVIATHLAVSEDTVKAHMRAVLSKIGEQIARIVAIALKRGIIEL